MKVYEITLKIYLIDNIGYRESFYKVSSFIDSGLSSEPKFLELHEKNCYKNYCFNSMYPIEKDGVYKKNGIYSIQLRTIDKELANFFITKLVNHFDNNIKALTSEIKIIPQKHIDKLYSITPAILKDNNGYWKNNMSIVEFEKRLRENLIKKYNLFIDTKICEDFQFNTSIEFKNLKPVAIAYKDVKILGDKISINISNEKIAQDLAYMSLGTGILEMNARGAGYVNFKWI